MKRGTKLTRKVSGRIFFNNGFTLTISLNNDDTEKLKVPFARKSIENYDEINFAERKKFQDFVINSRSFLFEKSGEIDGFILDNDERVYASYRKTLMYYREIVANATGTPMSLGGIGSVVIKGVNLGTKLGITFRRIAEKRPDMIFIGRERKKSPVHLMLFFSTKIDVVGWKSGCIDPKIKANEFFIKCLGEMGFDTTELRVVVPSMARIEHE